MTFASGRFRKAPAILALGAAAAVAFVLSVGMGAVALSPLGVLRSLAGLILDNLGYIPKAGDKLQWMGFEMEIMDMDRARIDKVLVSRRAS